MKKDNKTLSIKEAIVLLRVHKEGEKDRVHSIAGGEGFIMGCDIDLAELKKRMKVSTDISLSGQNMRTMKHGICFQQKGKDYLFLETDENKLQEFYEKRKIVM